MSSCRELRKDDALDRYVGGDLSTEEQEWVERHLLSCPHCLEELETLLALHTELARAAPEIRARAHRRMGSRWAVAAGIAAAVLLVGLGWWLRSPGNVQVALPPSTADGSAPEPAVEADTSGQREAPHLRRDILAELSKVDPPEYRFPVLRGTDSDVDRLFRQSVESYQRGDYLAATVDLRAAVELAPGAANLNYFLGISQLLSGETTAAIESLERTVALGESLYLEEARFYLAKAHLRLGHILPARAQLEVVAELEGPRAAEANRMLHRLSELPKRDDGSEH